MAEEEYMDKEVDWNALIDRLAKCVEEANRKYDENPINYYYCNEEQLRQIKELMKNYGK